MKLLEFSDIVPQKEQFDKLVMLFGKIDQFDLAKLYAQACFEQGDLTYEECQLAFHKAFCAPFMMNKSEQLELVKKGIWTPHNAPNFHGYGNVVVSHYTQQKMGCGTYNRYSTKKKWGRDGVYMNIKLHLNNNHGAPIIDMTVTRLSFKTIKSLFRLKLWEHFQIL